MKYDIRALFAYLSVAVAIGVALLIPVTAFAAPLTLQGGADAARGSDQLANIFGVNGIFSTITNVLLFLVGAISVIMVIFGGFRYIISGGNSTSVTAAKNTILYAVVGIVVALLAYAVVNFVIGSFTGGSGSGGFVGGTNT